MLSARPAPVSAAAEPRLGTAVNFAILAGSTITSTGLTVISGDLGLDPGTSVTGFPPGTVGVQHIGDAAAIQAKSDLAVAYNDAVLTPTTSNLTGQDLGGKTLLAGVYKFDTSAALTGNLTLTGPGVFIFQIGSTLTTAVGSAVNLIAGAQACAVYWQVGSSATLLTGTQLQGNLMALTSISMSSGASITGRAMAHDAAVTLIANTITQPTGACVPTPPSADIGITKTVDNATPNFGSNVTFTITATNHGPDNATGVQVSDVLPAGLTFVSASTGAYSSGTGVWNIGSLTNGTSATLLIVATVTGTAAVTNTATMSAEDQADPVSGNNSAGALITPVAADIAITKTVDNSTPNVGSNVTFTVTATNNGPSNATGVQVTDVLPAGLTFVSSSAGAYSSGSVVWNIGGLTNGTSATLLVVATVTGTTAATNIATRTGELQPDPVSTNDSASVMVTGQAADIAITKTVDNSTPNVGTNVTFTVTARNNGPSNATGVQVTDVLPAGLTFVSATPSAGTYIAGIWNVGGLTNGASATLSIVATVTGTTAVTNIATKTAELQPDPVSTNDAASVMVTGQSADIAVTKTVDNTTPNLGSNVTFTITARNNGPSNATGVQVTDVLPAGLTFVSASGGAYSSGTGVWNLGGLTNGTSATLLIVATVTGTTAVTNIATKSPGDQPDPVSTNDSASATVTGQAADIAITKSVDNSTPNLGSNVTFTITATNHGPDNATGVKVSDVLPAGLTFVSASTGAYSSGTGVWNIGGLTNGTSATLSIVATVTGTTAMTNTATKLPGDQADPVSLNDSAGATITPVAADIAITKTVDNSTPNVGTNVTFTVTARNNGPSNATGVQVTDVLPAGLTFVSASAGTYSLGTVVWNIGAMTSGTSATLLVVATVTGTAAAINIATKTAGLQPDPVSTNDSASATVTGQAADIAVTKTVDNPTPNLGSNVTFTVTARNNGPSNATGVQVTDVLPAGLTVISAAPSAGTYIAGIWNVGGLTNATNATLVIVATVTGTTAVTNVATKTAEVQPDLVSTNNSASVMVTGQAADIAVTKTVDNTTPNLGSNVTFTVTATNNGPSNATGVKVTDLLPTGLTFVSASAVTYSSGTGVWNIGGLTSGTSATLLIVATVTGTTTVTNMATKTAEMQPDLVSSNDSASVPVTGQAADIAITKTVDNATPNLGSNVTFTVTATNNGPSNATGVQVTDLLPAGLALVSATPSTGTYNDVTGLWSIGPLANGASVTLAMTATVSSASSVINTATKTSEVQPDLLPSNDSASVIVGGQAADIGATKTVDRSTPMVGQDVTYTLVAHNFGPSTATGVELRDVLPPGLTFVSYAATQGTYGVVTGIWAVGTMVNGSSASLSMVATVSTPGSIVNTVIVLGGSYFDANLSNNVSSAGLLANVPDLPGLLSLPGLPNTSAPSTGSGEPSPGTPNKLGGLAIAILVVVAGIGVLVLAGIGYRRKVRFRRRRSRGRQSENPARVAAGLFAIVVSLAISSLSVGPLASSPAGALSPGTQLIGSKVVSVAPPPAPHGDTFQGVTGPIIPSRLRIPSIDVDSRIDAVGLRADGSMDVPNNLWTSSWLAGGPRPGQAGNAVIAGHRGVGTPALFAHLEKVQPGDRIYVSNAAGAELTYVVTRVASLDLSRSTQVAVFQQTTTQQLVLITCFGRYVETARTYDHRLVVFSQPE